jgi:inner membrane protein
MDSLSQIALGSAVAVAAMGRRTAVWKAAAWGAVLGTLPDLDVVIDHGDPVSNMTMHRADSHALFWLTVVSPAFGLAAARLHREGFARWWLAAWLALVTHPLLDAMTVYGTQLLRPFDSTPYGVGSIFIIDPLYTLPLLAGVAAALRGARLRWNAAGLVLSTAYLGWSALAQAHVASLARASLAAQGIAAERVLVTPTPFNTVLWRVVAVDGTHFHEGFRSLLDRGDAIAFERFDAGAAWQPALAGHAPVARMAWFTRGFWALRRDGDAVVLTDLRMGQQPWFTFAFPVAALRDGAVQPQPVVRNAGARPPDIGAALRWVGRRALGEALPPPR